MRKYSTIDDVISYAKRMSENEYMNILDKIKVYLKSDRFSNTFACKNYVETIWEELVGAKEK